MNTRIIPRGLAFAVFLLAPCAARAQTDTVGSWLGDSVYHVIAGMSMSDGTPFTRYARVAQYYPNVAVEYAFGELFVRRASGTEGVPFERTVAGGFESPHAPVYEMNSTAFANPVLSRPFLIGAGDTISFYRDLTWRFPAGSGAGGFRLADTARMVTLDTLTFAVEILDTTGTAVLGTIERIVLPPCSGWFDFVKAMYSSTDSIWTPLLPAYYRCTYVVPSLLGGRAVRLRVTPECGGQERGVFTNRALTVQYVYAPKITAYLDAMWPEITHRARLLADSLHAVVSGASKTGVEPAAPRNDLAIYPTSLGPSGALVQIERSDAAEAERFQYALFDVAGNEIAADAFTLDAGERRRTLDLSRSPLARGYYVLGINSERGFAYSILHIK